MPTSASRMPSDGRWRSAVGLRERKRGQGRVNSARRIDRQQRRLIHADQVDLVPAGATGLQERIDQRTPAGAGGIGNLLSLEILHLGQAGALGHQRAEIAASHQPGDRGDRHAFAACDRHDAELHPADVDVSGGDLLHGDAGALAVGDLHVQACFLEPALVDAQMQAGMHAPGQEIHARCQLRKRLSYRRAPECGQACSSGRFHK